jgi:hypothetical protein
MIASLAVLLFVLGCVFHFMPSLDDGSAQFLAGVLWKIAMVLGLGWLASPQLERLGWQRVRGTMLIGIIIVIILYALRPRIGAVAALVLVAISAIAAIGGWVRRLSKPPSK